MRKYLITSPEFTGELIFGYDSEGILKYYENNAELKIEHLRWLHRHFPVVDSVLPDIVKKGKLQEITDLSFDNFWVEYNFKVGNKQMAEKLWYKLSEAERINILEHLPKYRYYLKTHQGLMQAYASTFLNQRRWENEYK
ncbi:MAG: hypothetical protein JXA16_00950 [Bacteroidales bacterium]|nr:hypothetical protein [Bacteroidales bacterium]